MIKLGRVDLQYLNNKQLFYILSETADKIKPETMELLLKNGFDISNATYENDKNHFNVFSIIDQFSDKVLSLLKKQDSIKTLLENNRGYFNDFLRSCISQSELKSVKILFEKFDAINYIDYYEHLETAISKNNLAMVKYLLGQAKKLSGSDDPEHARREKLINGSSRLDA